MLKRMKMAIAAGLALAVSACLFIPGKFNSDMTVDRDGSFAFSYRGEIVMLPSPAMLDELDEPFEPECFGKDDKERPCTAKEVAEQREEHETDAAMGMAMMTAMTGGIDPNDADSVALFTDKLMKHTGWTSVVHRGNGVFDVIYEIEGTLDRDFVWPVFPDMDFVNPYIIASRRADGSVMITAPGFANKDGTAVMGPMVAAAASGDKDGAKIPSTLDGTFTIRTDGEIATNNTEDGAMKEGSRQKLAWRVTSATKVAPGTLIRLDR